MTAIRIAAAFSLSLALHAAFAAGMRHFSLIRPLVLREEQIAQRPPLVSEWIVPTPSPPPELPKSIARIDISAIEAQRAIAGRMQIVLLAAKLGNGQPSRAPHLYRVGGHSRTYSREGNAARSRFRYARHGRRLRPDSDMDDRRTAGPSRTLPRERSRLSRPRV